MARVTMSAAAGAALLSPCSAFVSQGSLRGQTPALTVGHGVVQQPAAAGARSSTTFAAASAAVLGAAAGAARAAGRKQQRGVECRGEVGVCLPLTEKWDPLKLGDTDAKMDYNTAAEIKHGRIAMLATMGYILPEVFRFPGCETFGNGLSALDTIPFEGWLQLVAFVSAHEVFVKPRKDGMGLFDFGLGTELLDGIDAEELERRQTVERNNGRLAMIAIMGMLFQDSMFGKTPLALIKSDGFWGPSVEVFVKDIPICAGLCAMDKTAEVSPAVPFLNYPVPLKGYVGEEKGFDPLGVSDALPVYYLRESELKHGRVCMLATLGWIATDLGVRFPGEQFQNVSTVGAHDKMVELGLMQPFLATVAAYEVYGWWIFQQGFEKNINREAGDFFFGKSFLPSDPAQAKLMKLKELENGRLAMLAFGGIATQAVMTGKAWPFL